MFRHAAVCVSMCRMHELTQAGIPFACCCCWQLSETNNYTSLFPTYFHLFYSRSWKRLKVWSAQMYQYSAQHMNMSQMAYESRLFREPVVPTDKGSQALVYIWQSTVWEKSWRQAEAKAEPKGTSLYLVLRLSEAELVQVLMRPATTLFPSCLVYWLSSSRTTTWGVSREVKGHCNDDVMAEPKFYSKEVGQQDLSWQILIWLIATAMGKILRAQMWILLMLV